MRSLTWLAIAIVLMTLMCLGSCPTAVADPYADDMRVNFGEILVARGLELGYESCLDHVADVMQSRSADHGEQWNVSQSTLELEDDLRRLWSFVSGAEVETVTGESQRSKLACSSEPSQVVFCRIIFQRSNACHLQDHEYTSPQGICLELWYLQGVLAPALVLDDYQLVPWLRFLAGTICPRPENITSRCWKPQASDFNPSVPQTPIHSCPRPFLPVTNQAHTSLGFRDDVIRSLQYVMRKNGDQRVNISDLPERMFSCGDHCMSEIDETERRVRFAANLVRVAFILYLLLPSLVIVVTIRTGLKAMWEYPNRLMVYLTISLFVYNLLTLPHFLEPITGRSIGCNADMSLATTDDLRKSPLAMFSYIVGQFGFSTFRLWLVFISFAWWQLVMKLQHCHSSPPYVIKIEGPVEAVFHAIIFAWGVAMTILYAKGPFKVLFVVHNCYSITDYSQWLILGPEIVTSTLAVLLMCDGCRRLWCLRRTSQNFRRQASVISSNVLLEAKEAVGRNTDALQREGGPSQTTCSSHQSSSTRRGEFRKLPSLGRSLSLPFRRQSSLFQHTKADKTMGALLQRFVLYIFGIVLTTSIELIFRMTQPVSDPEVQAFEQRQVFAKCMLATCGDTARCQSLQPRLAHSRFVMHIVFDSVHIVNSFLMLSWIFRPSVWKRRSPNDKQNSPPNAIRRKRYTPRARWRRLSPASTGFSVSTTSGHSIASCFPVFSRPLKQKGNTDRKTHPSSPSACSTKSVELRLSSSSSASKLHSRDAILSSV